MKKILHIRPHHGLCLQHFTGKGYSPQFVENMTEIQNQLKVNPDQVIYLSGTTDVLCEACPHNLGGVCETGQKVARYDERCLHYCGLKNGQTVTWREFQNIITEAILNKGRLREICSDCSWSGICSNMDTAYQNN